MTALLVRNNKLLLVRDGRSGNFALLGGSVEAGENNFTALKRELLEEVGLSLVSASLLFSFDLVNDTYQVPQTDHVYSVIVEGEPKASAEIVELGWYSREDILSKKVKTPQAFYEKLIPKLIEDSLI